MSIWIGGGGSIPIGGIDLPVIPSGGGLGPAPGKPTTGTTEPGDVTRSSSPSPVGTGSNWTATLQALAVAGGEALINRWTGHDSRSTKHTTPTPDPTVEASPLPGKVDPGGPWNELSGIARRAQDELNAPASGSGINPLLLAAGAAALVLVLVISRR